MIKGKEYFFEVINVTLGKYANMPYNEVKKEEKYDLNTISRVCKLSIEKIKEIINSMKNSHNYLK